MEKQYICKKGWKRHSQGTIISEWDWKRLAIESREQFFEEYIKPVTRVLIAKSVINPVETKNVDQHIEEVVKPESMPQAKKKFNFDKGTE